jgi:hypothetical protein
MLGPKMKKEKRKVRVIAKAHMLHHNIVSVKMCTTILNTKIHMLNNSHELERIIFFLGKKKKKKFSLCLDLRI